jgi:ABC-type branched-subunit amino acid transport system substrate-binding protein
VTPFHQFRLWLRRGPSPERVAAGIAAAVLVALVAWALVPVRDDDASTVEAGADQPLTAGAGAATATTVAGTEPTQPAAASDAPVAGAAPSAAPGATGTSGAVGATAAAGAGACSDLRATDPGVNGTEVLLALAIINLTAVGNQAVGLRSPEQIQAAAQAVVDGINRDGGVACRKLRLKSYLVSPVDSNDQRAKCLQIQSDKPFAVVDFGGFYTSSARSCIAAAKIPLVGTGLDEVELVGSFPYLLNVGASNDAAARSWVYEAAARGTFDPAKGFRKLGLLLKECYPQVNEKLVADLAKVGLGRDKTSTFTTSCGISPPSQLSQAALQFRSDGVTHAFLAASGPDSQTFVRQADAARYKPVYLLSDFSGVTSATLANGWPDGFDGAVAITGSRTGERNSGIPNALVTSCNDWMKRGGVPPSQTEQDIVPVNLCDEFRFIVAAMNGVGPNLKRVALADGLQKAGRFSSAVLGDGVFDRRGKVWGGDFIRAIRWELGCKCWKVVDRDVKRGR